VGIVWSVVVTSPELLAAVAQQIKRLRVARGLTQEAMAESLEIAPKNVQRLEAGRQNLTLATLQNVADVLDVEPQELLAPLEPSRDADAASLARAFRGLVKHGAEIAHTRTRPKRDFLPLMTLQAAASRFGSAKEVEVKAWVKLRGARPSALEGRFIAQIKGTSMQPTVPSAALGLFRAPVIGSLEGRIVLAELRGMADPESGGAYALKRVGPIESRREGGFRMHLLSDNPDFAPIIVEGERATELRVVAELERVLWPIKSI
jgi:transcriptional regulator with XRE-family HTH domain